MSPMVFDDDEKWNTVLPFFWLVKVKLWYITEPWEYFSNSSVDITRTAFGLESGLIKFHVCIMFGKRDYTSLDH